MSTNRAPRRIFNALALLAVLVLASLPAQARPVRNPVSDLPTVAFSRIWRFVADLWKPALPTKEGMSIDPNGGSHGGTPVPSPGAHTDEGTSIDPNGRQ